MIALDTNVLVYAHRVDSEWHDRAATRMRGLAEGRAPWAIPWPCIHEFLAIVSHPRIFDPPTPADAALDQVDSWLESPSVVVLGEGSGHWNTIRSLVQAARVAGPKVHDARIAAICLEHGVDVLWTADRDFGRFPALRTLNPLAEDLPRRR
ncbi:MAG: TA system VapC family ribonuclease toxin [Thermodesulfobacteriota bacterium]